MRVTVGFAWLSGDYTFDNRLLTVPRRVSREVLGVLQAGVGRLRGVTGHRALPVWGSAVLVDEAVHGLAGDGVLREAREHGHGHLRPAARGGVGERERAVCAEREMHGTDRRESRHLRVQRRVEADRNPLPGIQNYRRT